MISVALNSCVICTKKCLRISYFCSELSVGMFLEFTIYIRHTNANGKVNFANWVLVKNDFIILVFVYVGHRLTALNGLLSTFYPYKY